MYRHIKYTMLVALLIFGIGQSAYAVTEIGPVDPLTGFPVWVRDANLLQLQPCGEPTAELTPGCIGFESIDPANNAFVLGNIAEFSYYRAEAVPDTGASGAVFRLRLQVQGADLAGAGNAADSVIGNEVLIRWRGLPNITGDYTFVTPMGSFTMNANPTDCTVTGDNLLNCPDTGFLDTLGVVPDFAATLAGAVTVFMSNTPDTLPIGVLPNQDPNLIFLGDFFTEAPLNLDGFVPPLAGAAQEFRISPPGGADIGNGAGVDVVAATFLVEGLTIDCDNNQPPLAVDDPVGVEADTPTPINVAANDQGNQDGVGNLLAFDLPLRPDTAAVATAPAAGNAVANGDGTITYTANAGTLGADSFTYTIQDGCLAPPGPAATATVNIFVEDLGVTKATLRVKQMKWIIEGQTSDNRADNIMTIHAGGDGTGDIIGTAAVDAGTGQWSFEGNATANPGASGMISCRSSNGALLPNIPLSLR